MGKLAVFGFTTALALSALALWSNSPRSEHAVSGVGLSPYELQLHIDIKNMPELKIEDPI